MPCVCHPCNHQHSIMSQQHFHLHFTQAHFKKQRLRFYQETPTPININRSNALLVISAAPGNSISTSISFSQSRAGTTKPSGLLNRCCERCRWWSQTGRDHLEGVSSFLKQLNYKWLAQLQQPYETWVNIHTINGCQGKPGFTKNWTIKKIQILKQFIFCLCVSFFCCCFNSQVADSTKSHWRNHPSPSESVYSLQGPRLR